MLKKVSAFLALIVSLFALMSLAAAQAQQTSNGATSGATPQPGQSAEQKQETKPTPPPQNPPRPTGNDIPTIISERTDEVALTVTVTDPYNRLVTGLEKKHFEIFEDKVKQTIEASKTMMYPSAWASPLMYQAA